MKTILLLCSAVIITACGRKQHSETLNLSDFLIAYNVAVKDSAGNTNWEIFSMKSDGSSSSNITNNADVAWTYTANGSDLYFISDRDTSYRCFFLYKSNSDGSEVKKISELRLEDSWMSVANQGNDMYVSGRTGEARYQLFVINIKSGSYRQVTNDTSAVYKDPSISPDGTKVAFVFKKNRLDISENEEIWIMNTDGSDLNQLTHYPQDNISRFESGYKAGSPQWHPSGKFITFISFRDGRHKIYAINSDGTNERVLIEDNYSDGWHSWSPDGNWLIFDSTDSLGSQYHIQLLDYFSGKITRLTDSTYKSQLAPVFLKKKV